MSQYVGKAVEDSGQNFAIHHLCVCVCVCVCMCVCLQRAYRYKWCIHRSTLSLSLTHAHTHTHTHTLTHTRTHTVSTHCLSLSHAWDERQKGSDHAQTSESILAISMGLETLGLTKYMLLYVMHKLLRLVWSHAAPPLIQLGANRAHTL